MNHDDFSILGFALVAAGSHTLPRLAFPGFPMVNVRTKVTLEPLGFCKILKVSWSLQFAHLLVASRPLMHFAATYQQLHHHGCFA